MWYFLYWIFKYDDGIGQVCSASRGGEKKFLQVLSSQLKLKLNSTQLNSNSNTDYKIGQSGCMANATPIYLTPYKPC